MSPQTLRILIALVFVVHGIGHTMGALAITSLSDDIETWSGRSWLLTDLLGDTVARAICGVVFAGLSITFVISALALMGWLVPHDWWRPLAVISAVVSLIALALYWNAFVELVPNKIGAIAVNGAILAAEWIANWPTEADIGF